MSSNRRRAGKRQQNVTAGALEDARAEVLARVYALILSWPTSEEKQDKQQEGGPT